MYAGTTVGSRSGNVIGTHQRIDKIAHKHLKKLLKKETQFPDIKRILHFEGNNGPDSVKRKSPSIDEPWHFIDPQKEDDESLMQIINDHLANLTTAIRDNNSERAAFEAAWVAHAVVDGLTPAHHFPLADKIEELFGMPHYERSSMKQKNLIRGSNRRDTLAKNWEYWGGGGVFSSHVLFELGIASTMIGRKYVVDFDEKDLVDLKLLGYEAVFRQTLQAIVALDIYGQFRRSGWNWKVARLVHRQLLPMIIKAVTLAWYWAISEAEVLDEG